MVPYTELLAKIKNNWPNIEKIQDSANDTSKVSDFLACNIC